jgi:hypothetical protein
MLAHSETLFNVFVFGGVGGLASEGFERAATLRTCREQSIYAAA